MTDISFPGRPSVEAQRANEYVHVGVAMSSSLLDAAEARRLAIFLMDVADDIDADAHARATEGVDDDDF